MTPGSVLKWIVIVAVLYFSGTEAETVGFPAPHLFAALVLSLGRISEAEMPSSLYISAQAVTGVVLGTYVSFSSVTAVGANWAAVAAITALTLAVSVGLGVLLARRSGMDAPTASLGMIAGGSAGIVATSEDLGADARLVAFMQYLRLVLVVLTAPLLVRYVLHPHVVGEYGAIGPKEIEVEASFGAYVFCAAVAGLGASLALRLRLPAGALIGPLLLAAVLTGSGLVHRVTPPEFPREAAFTLIGLYVGMCFTRATIARVGRLLPSVFAFVTALIVITGLLAWGLSLVTSIDVLDAYLATTPGGINAVLVVAFASGAHTGFVFAVQTLRLFVMVLTAPYLVRRVLKRTKPARSRADVPSGGEPPGGASLGE